MASARRIVILGIGAHDDYGGGRGSAVDIIDDVIIATAVARVSAIEGDSRGRRGGSAVRRRGTT